MAIDCNNTLEVREAVCKNATDMQEMITGGENDTTTNYGAKTIAKLVTERIATLGTFTADYIWQDLAEQTAQAGMTLNQSGYQIDDQNVYKFDGTSWVSQGVMPIKDLTGLLNDQSLTLKNDLETEGKVYHKDGDTAYEVSIGELANSVKQVDTIADLRSMTTSYNTLWVSGYHTKGDGAFGSNIFEWDSTSAEDDNGGTIIKLDSVTNGRYLLRYNGAADVKWFGASEIRLDNEIPIQSAIMYAIEYGQSVFIPSGRFNISSSIDIAPSGTGQLHINLSLKGEGDSTILLHGGTSSLFNFTGLIHRFNASEFIVYSTTLKSLETQALFYFPDGNSQSYYNNITYGVEQGEVTYPAQFYYCGVGEVNDTISFNHCIVEKAVVGGYHIGAGSSIYINGGRVVGTYPEEDTHGLILSGGNGGVYVWATDFISLKNGILITNTSGVSNREIFLSNGTVDGCNIGLNIEDESYVSCVGLWAASADEANINYVPSTNSPNAILNISGGSIFNAGSQGGEGNAIGMKYNGNGRFQLDNVVFRNNDGRAFAHSGVNALYRSKFSNCEFISNAEDTLKATDCMYLGGMIDVYNCSISGTVTNIVFDSVNKESLAIKGCRGFPNPVNISVPTSNIDSTNTSGFYADVYFREGLVNSIWVNGNPIYAFSTATACNNMISLAPGDTYKLVYTSTPNSVWVAGS